MSPTFLRRIKPLVFGLLASLALLAQVDPNLATSTDLLDVYKSGGVKPEMITMFDFSGSMTGVFWSSKYWTNVDYGTHVGGTPGDGSRLSFTVNSIGGSGGYTSTNYVTMSAPTTSSSATTCSSLSGYLVNASGTAVTTPASGNVTLTNALTATHARMTMTLTINTGTSRHPVNTTYTRTVDMPFPWTLMKRTTTAPTGTNLPAWIDCVADPDIGSSSNYIPYDNVYTTATSVDGNSSTSLTSWFDFTTDYVYWMFWGTDDASTGGTGTYNDDNGIAPPGGGGYVIGGATTNAGAKTAFSNGLPVGTRAQYLKKAVLATWFANRSKVWWAYRFLDCTNEEAKTTVNSLNFTSGQWNKQYQPRELTMFKTAATNGAVTGYSDPSVTYFQSRTPQNSTPLTYALANSLAQMTLSDSTSIFSQTNTALAIGGSGETPPPCRSSYVILFTDGNANDSKSGTCQHGGDGSAIGPLGGTWTTAAQIQAIPYSDLAPGTSTSTGYFNIWTLAAVAAHGNANASQLTSGSGTPAAFAPFNVMSRGSTSSAPRAITTMTVGLCLAGTSTDTSGGKGPLLAAALFGDPKLTNFDITTAVPYGASGGSYQTNFFDASNPTTLVNSLAVILRKVVQANAGITAPSAPLVGLNLGNRAYLGSFEATNTSGGSIWQGDLLMTGIGIQSSGTVGLKDKYNQFVTQINANNAVASAANMLYAKSWRDTGTNCRNIYTVIPGHEPALGGAALDLTASAQNFSDQNSLLTDTVMGTTDPTGGSANSGAWQLIRFIRGACSVAQADTTHNPTTKTGSGANRTDLMGDIINSSPAAIQYDPSLIPSTSPLSSAWTSTYSSMTGAGFRVVFVGDNQGLFHAFGEVSGVNSSGVLQAQMDELWAFVPSEYLNNPAGPSVNKLGQLMTGDPINHIYTVDGSPVIYWNNSNSGNLWVDSSDTVRVIFGLRKGGRSYYALDVANPGHPYLAWMINPNTATNATLQTMGLATSSIGLAEVMTSSSSTPVDVAILGGGYSNTSMDGLTIGNNTAPAKLGRSLLALNVQNGGILKTYDFVKNATLASQFPNIGSLTSGGYPFQFLSGTGMAQRIYFADQNGGVYALGSMQKLTSGAAGFRVDSSNIDQWTTDGSANVSTTPGNPGIRWIFKGATTLTSGNVTAASPITTPPVAFKLTTSIPQFRRPSTVTDAPNMIPPVVGVTFGTGDRNDPMDNGSIKPVGNAPNMQVVVFDRQDSGDLPTVNGLPSSVDTSGNAISAPGSSSLLVNMTTNAVPGDTSYLGNNQHLGYYLNYHSPAADPNNAAHLFFEKAYLTPVVLNGGLVFSTFTPTTSGTNTSCAGSGVTNTYLIANVLSPVFQSGNTTVSDYLNPNDAAASGKVFTWSNLAGDLTAIGNQMLLQSGQIPIGTTGTSGSATLSSAFVQSINVPGGTSSFAPRSWRIVR